MDAKTPVSCPDLESLAAFAEGGLTPAERPPLREHLAGCPDCAAVVASVVREAREPAPWTVRLPLALAATVLLVAGLTAGVLVTRPWQRAPGREGGPEAVASPRPLLREAPVESLLALAAPADLARALPTAAPAEQSFSGGPDRRVRDLRLGVATTDLTIALAAADTGSLSPGGAAAPEQTKRLVREIRDLAPPGVSDAWTALARTAPEAEQVSAELARLAEAVRASGGGDALALGEWIAAARIAAGVGLGRFFDRPRPEAPPGLPQDVLDLLRQVDGALAAPGGLDLIRLHELLEELLLLC